MDRAQWRAKKIMKGLERLSYDERLKELKLYSLEKRKLREGRWLGDLISIWKYPKEECKEDRTKLFPMVLSARPRDDRHKLKCRRFHLNFGKRFTVQVV